MKSIWNELAGVDFKHTYYDCNGIKTRTIEAGEGEPLLFLHGTGGHAEAYMKNIAEHAKHFKVYTIDLVGHGYSGTPDIDYTMQHYVDHISAFADTVGANKLHISGESLGASIAVWFALQYPNRVNKLVLNTGIPLAPQGEGITQMENLLERTRKATGGAPTLDAIRARMRWLVLEEESLSDEIIDTRFAIYSQNGRAEVIRKITEEAIGCLIDPEALKSWYNPDNLKNISHKTLLLWTDHNPGQPVALAEKAAGLIPNSELAVISKAAHWPQWEQPEQFNEIHIKFLKS